MNLTTELKRTTIKFNNENVPVEDKMIAIMEIARRRQIKTNVQKNFIDLKTERQNEPQKPEAVGIIYGSIFALIFWGFTALVIFTLTRIF